MILYNFNLLLEFQFSNSIFYLLRVSKVFKDEIS